MAVGHRYRAVGIDGEGEVAGDSGKVENACSARAALGDGGSAPSIIENESVVPGCADQVRICASGGGVVRKQI